MKRSFSVAVLGASNNPERYSYQVIAELKKQGYRVFPIHPTEKEILGFPVFSSLDYLPETPDVLTIYVRPEITEELLGHLEDLRPGVVLLNPGTSSPKIIMALEKSCIPYHEVCTLTLLRTGRFSQLLPQRPLEK